MLARIVNFLASGENPDCILTLANMSIHLSSDRQDQAIARLTDRYAEWDELRCGAMDWFEKLPYTFRPCARVSWPPSEHDGSVSGLPLFSEICFSILMCAASVQHYHFARILLLLHQPVARLQGHNIADRLRRYRHISEEVDHHAREICGIALANSPGAVRIHMLQPLYLSGLCLEHREERETILKLLRGIEAELGWTTSHRVDRIQADWSRENGWTIVSSSYNLPIEFESFESFANPASANSSQVLDGSSSFNGMLPKLYSRALPVITSSSLYIPRHRVLSMSMLIALLIYSFLPSVNISAFCLICLFASSSLPD